LLCSGCLMAMLLLRSILKYSPSGQLSSVGLNFAI
jgi:hypothetical protein